MKKYYSYLCHNSRKITAITLLCSFFCFVLFLLFSNTKFFRLTSMTADWTDHSDNLKKLSKQLKDLEISIQDKKRNLPVLYGELLRSQGKLKCQTIVQENASRLNIADVSLHVPKIFWREQAKVSRHSAMPRYTAATFDITCSCAATAYELNQIFANTPMAGLGEAFIRAEEDSGINAMFLASIAVVESNWGASTLAREKNNLFGFGAYTNSPDSASAFATKSECILYVARFLRDHYIEGSYYRGRFITDINKLYASDPNWSEKIFSAMLRLNELIQKNTR